MYFLTKTQSINTHLVLWDALFKRNGIFPFYSVDSFLENLFAFAFTITNLHTFK